MTFESLKKLFHSLRPINKIYRLCLKTTCNSNAVHKHGLLLKKLLPLKVWNKDSKKVEEQLPQFSKRKDLKDGLALLVLCFGGCFGKSSKLWSYGGRMEVF
jgi:hypothetical protein